MTYRRRLFVAHYLGKANGNATEAARLSGYRQPHMAGPRLMEKDGIRAAIEAHLSGPALAADEVLARLSDMASASLDDFLEIDDDGGFKVDLAKAKRRGKLHTLKRLKQTKDGEIDIQIHDPLAALEKLGRYHRLFDGPPTKGDDAADLIRAIREAV